MRTSRTMIAAAALAAATLILGACSSGSSSTSTTGATTGVGDGSASASSGAAGSGLPATVDTMFGQVEIPAPADGDLTVVALGWSDAEVALALGVKPVAVYDWQGFGEPNKGVGPWATELFGDVTPTVLANSGDSLDYEAIQVLEPDLILNTRSGGDQAQYERLSSIAPTVSPPAGTVQDGRTVFLAADDQVAQAFSAASPLSIPIAVEGIVPQLAKVTAG